MIKYCANREKNVNALLLIIDQITHFVLVFYCLQKVPMKATSSLRVFFQSLSSGKFDDQAVVSYFSKSGVTNLSHFGGLNCKGDAVKDAVAASNALKAMAVTGARHSTSMVTFDRLIYQDQHVQKQLATVELSRFALDSLALLVAEGIIEAEDAPLLQVYTHKALRDSIKASTRLYGGYSARYAGEYPKKAVPHRSDSTVLIDYTVLDSARELYAQLNKSSPNATASLAGLIGTGSIKAPAVSLSACHPYLTNSQEETCQLLSSALSSLSKAKGAIAEAEAIEAAATSMAVYAAMHRSSVAMTIDEPEEGRVQWGLIQGLVSSAKAEMH
jgi:hypothetical protein